MRVVIDTNVLLVSIGRKSRHNWLFQVILDERCTVLVSTDILLEYEEIITRRTRADIALDVIQTLVTKPNVERTEPYYRWNLIADDPTDNKFVDCAFAGRADALVTEDRHFDILSTLEFPRVTILTIQQFAESLNSSA